MKSIIEIMEEKLPNIDDLSEKQQAVARSALILFSQKGFHQTSTKDIASHANVSEGTVYKHFQNKENLLFGIILPLFKEFVIPVVLEDMYQSTEAANQHPFYSLLEKIVRNRIAFAQQNKEIIMVFAREIVFREEFKNSMHDFISVKATAKFQPVIQAYIDKGELKNIDPRQITYFIFVNVFGTVLPALLFDKEITEATIQQLIDFIHDGLRPR
ncbi:TetR/AcrR family transcriptional regulator [Gracilibacillus alcaliphilus]|uniref:TetR/AcrR family transcriptional regulator n=1 Tax=Gracilibacillus alcaliphilus TaxID=1401441 RepID=UPI00195C9A5B|nr:TetR/AcrR family transcriptional regulator [Gracilibacillus alcaliphilus]MBM7676480.1 AcrR family transcriptional regulator [Gracilibacillus alcaliphilus]